MENSTNYDLKLYEGSDKFNPLNVDVPNFETIDEVMKANEITGVQPATELVSGTVHEITRSNADAQVFRFVATAKWELGDSMSIDGTPVTVLLPSGKTIPDGAYVIGANVIGVLVGTNCTLYLSETGGTAENSEKLGGELPSYYAKDSDLDNLNTVVTSIGSITTNLNNNKLVYNSTTDKIDVYMNGSLVGSLTAGFMFDGVIYDNGTEKKPVDISNAVYHFRDFNKVGIAVKNINNIVMTCGSNNQEAITIGTTNKLPLGNFSTLKISGTFASASETKSLSIPTTSDAYVYVAVRRSSSNVRTYLGVSSSKEIGPNSIISELEIESYGSVTINKLWLE